MRPAWFHLAKGSYPRQARVGVGELYEEHVSRLGFTGAVAMLYHRRGATEFVSVDPELSPPPVAVKRLVALDATDPSALPLALYENDDLTLLWSQRQQPHPFAVRNLDGDQLMFVHSGTGLLETEFGSLSYRSGDFLYIPKAVTYRVIPEGPNEVLIIETRSQIEPFDIGAAGRHAPFDPTVLEIPDPSPHEESEPGEFPVMYKRNGRYLRAVLRHDPFDVLGWKGDLFPFRLHIDDILPIHSERSHLAPSIGGIFCGDGFVVSNLLPQPAVSDLEAEELPDYHRNAEYDEFWCIHNGGGLFEDGGQLVYTPQGMVHGTTEEVRKAHQQHRREGDRRTVTAVGVEARKPLCPTAEYLKQIES